MATKTEKRSYWDKLRDPRWQRKRLEIMERDGFACRCCGQDTETLNVHHGYYEKGLEPWEYENDTLWTLCEHCHVLVADHMRLTSKAIAKIPPGGLLWTSWRLEVAFEASGRRTLWPYDLAIDMWGEMNEFCREHFIREFRNLIASEFQQLEDGAGI